MLASCLLAGAALFANGATFAQDYPSKPITFIVQFAAGGTTDLSARKLASLAEKELGQPIIIKNVTGATGNIGHNTIARADPDGYTIGAFAYSGTVLLPHVQSVPFDTRADFTFIAQYCDLPQVLVVAENGQWKDLKHLISWARDNPGALTYGTTGPGSAQNFFMELLAKNAGLKLTHVPYRGGSAAALAVLSGDTKAALSAEGASMAQSGKVRAIAVLGEQRLAGLPNVPTFAELGYNIPMPLWVGIVGPRGMKEPVRTKLEQAFGKASEDASYKQALDNMMLTPKFRDGAAFRSLVLKDYERGREIVTAVGQAKP
jgi:tripartite-type tricarboxylate transporter receptor subunit TctC